MRNRIIILLAFCATILMVSGAFAGLTAQKSSAAPSTYLTILFGRTQEYPTNGVDNCAPYPDTVSLNQAVSTLYQMGIATTGAVIVDRTAPTTTSCIDSDAYPSWAQLQSLNQEGMTFISAGIDYENNTQLTQQQAEQNICGSLPAFQQHGQNFAWGLFAYPNNASSPQLQANVTSTCFAFGRKYGPTVNTNASAPYVAVTDSITGGACNTPALPCSKLVTTADAHNGNTTSQVYWSLPNLEAHMNPTSGTWSVVQMYKFVTGSYRPGATSGPTWDCTSSDWRKHYSTISESYCWNDFLTAIKSIPSSVTVTYPAAVATAWGRS